MKLRMSLKDLGKIDQDGEVQEWSWARQGQDDICELFMLPIRSLGACS
ncbi:MAG: hypothetical protein HW403_989 [Dehalococcoidia bacterium]|nr:hypothetical protein [Dehalococcoidia bacterium]